MISFDKQTHTYTQDGRLLLSVTEVIKRYVFPDMYSNVPEEVLAKAADRGTATHAIIEKYIKGTLTNEEYKENKADVDAFVNEISKHHFYLSESERIVSDGELLAGTIDIIGMFNESEGDRLMIADIKTTSKLNIEYLQWQLSLYSYLMCKSVGKEYIAVERPDLYGIHLRDGKCKIVKIEQLPLEAIESLLDAIRNNVQPEDWKKPQSDLLNVKELTEQYRAAFAKRAELQEKVKELDEEIESCLAEIKQEFLRIGTYKEAFDDVEISLPTDTIRRTFDKAVFSKRHPELKAELDECCKETRIEGKIKIKFVSNGTED